MILKGQPIADSIYQKLIPFISALGKKDITPTLQIILIGNNPRSVSYVNQKKINGNRIGVNVFIDKKDEDITEEQLKTIIKNYNADSSIHGLIVQLPLPSQINENQIIQSVTSSKDVDGFLSNSPFINPLAKAVLTLLKKNLDRFDNKKICVIGKGKTGGAPIYRELKKMTESVVQIDRATKDPDKIIQSSDIVISCVGKRRVVNSKNCKKGATLISAGLHSENGKLKGDYDEEEIKNIASYYTPTPGGIGPVNVACLLENTVLACENQNKI